MAARKQLFHPDVVRKKIQASQLINRLKDHVMSPHDLMTSNQVQAANILLRKAIPDLSAVEYKGEDGGPMDIRITIGGNPIAKSDD